MNRKSWMLPIGFFVSTVAFAQAGAEAMPHPGAPVALSADHGPVLAFLAAPAGQVHANACSCPRTPSKTARIEGRGSSCAAALDNLSYLTDAQVEANCALGSDGVCTEGDVIVTLACAYNPSAGQYSVTGYRQYTCQFCR